MIAVTAPVAHVFSFTAVRHHASLVVRPPRLRGSSKLDIVISSPHDLGRGPVKYVGGYKQQKLAAAVFPFNTPEDFFAAGLALNAGGGPVCVLRADKDVCHTMLGAGFLHLRHARWRKLKITIFKPARQPAEVRVLVRLV